MHRNQRMGFRTGVCTSACIIDPVQAASQGLGGTNHCEALSDLFRDICGMFKQHHGRFAASTSARMEVGQGMTPLLLVLMQVESIREEMHLEIHGLVEIIEEQADALHDLEDRLANRLRW